MLARTDRILAVFERKLAALNLDKKAADDAGPEEKQIAEDLFEIMQKLDGTKSEKRGELPRSLTGDFELIGRDWMAKGALHQDTAESNSNICRMKKKCRRYLDSELNMRTFEVELERAKLEEELEGLIKEEEDLLEGMEENRKDFSNDDWEDIIYYEKDDMEALEQMRDDRKLCEAKLALVRKILNAWKGRGRLNYRGEDAPQCQHPSKVLLKDPSQREPPIRDNAAAPFHPATGAPDSSARSHATLQTSVCCGDPPISCLNAPVGALPFPSPFTSSTTKLPETIAPGAASKASPCNFPPSSSLSENLRRASEASDMTYADSERSLASRPSDAQQQEQLPRSLIENTFPAAGLPMRPRGLPYMGEHYPQAAFPPSLYPLPGRQYLSESPQYYPYHGISWYQPQPLGSISGTATGINSMTPPNGSAYIQHLPRTARSSYSSYNGIGNPFVDQAPRWY